MAVESMKYLLVVGSRDAETVCNALRFGCAVLSRGHEASAFLLGPAVEIEQIGDERFDVQTLLLRFDELGGAVLSCCTGLRLRQVDAAPVCPGATMDDLARLTEEADRTLTFG
jgi:sulfur relay (sulfurtransferase) complex TusBCD TusD component (DsrE family)